MMGRAGLNADGRGLGRGRPRVLVAVVLVLAGALLITAAAGALPPVANDDMLTVAEDGFSTVDVLANDSDPDGDTLTISDWTDGANGFVSCFEPTCDYVPKQDFSGSDSFTYTVDDGTGGMDTATVSVTVTPVQDSPEAGADSLQLGGATSGSLNVLANDTDPDGDAISVTGSTNGSFGTVSCEPAGTCTYTGGPSFAGKDAFTYTVEDTAGNSDSGLVTVCAQLYASPSALANAIAADAGTVSGASYTAIPPCGKPNAVSSAALTAFPRPGSSSYAIMTSGNADLADDPNTAGNSGADLDGQNVRGNTDFDVTILKIDLNVPAGRNCLTFDFRFLSEEFPEFVGSSFNDAFIAELDTSSWTTAGSTITAPNNFAFDPSGDVISINSSGATSMSAAEATGTTYDGATPLLAASTPITSGAHSLYLSIFDQRDQIYDSAVFVDDLVLGTTAPGGCEAGATGLTTAKTADSPTTPAGGLNGYTITISNPSNAAVSLNSIFDVLPAGFTYVNGSTTGVTTANPTINGQTLTWAGPFTVPAGGNVTLHFGVTVSSIPGEYFNDAGGDAATGAVSPTGPTAPITVTAAPSANLSITKTDAPDPVTVGQNLTYTITVSNAGPDPAQGVVVSDTLPAGVTFVSATPSQETGCTGTTTISCPLGTIASGGSATVTIVVTPTAPNPALSNTATVSASTADPNPDNNSATATTVVNPAPTGPVCNGLAATFVGGPGKDDFQGGPGVDVVVDLGGDNYIQTGGGNDHICLGPGNDEVDSGDGNDFVDAGAGKNKVKTGNGDDSVRAGAGDDEIDTGNGQDNVVDLGGKNKIFTGNEADVVTAGSGNDEIETGDGDDVVAAGDGNNKIVTGNGNDQITAGAGDDEIDGGNGFDTCNPGAGANKVKDCEALPVLSAGITDGRAGWLGGIGLVVGVSLVAVARGRRERARLRGGQTRV